MTRDEYLRLVGLLSLGAELMKQEQAIIRSVAALLGEKPDAGHSQDALWNGYTADALLEKSGITVVDDAVPATPEATEETHTQRHGLLHKMLDELSADFLSHNAGKRPSNTTLMELIEWSHRQTLTPDGEEPPA